jgi:Zn-dependent peptidase ImmA (M78 family)
MPGSQRRKPSDLSLEFRLSAEKISLAHRRKLSYGATERLCEKRLVEDLGVPLASLTDFFEVEPHAVFELYTHQARRAAFSATAVCDGNRPIGVVFNDAHESVRQRADIAHEWAHIHLGHLPSSIRDADGRRIYPELEEAEAHWLGPALLVPRDGLLAVLRRNPRLIAVAEHFDVSLELVRFRYNTTGCKRHIRVAA